MAQPSNVFSSYDAIGNREDLSDNIYDISPTETPFMNSIAKTKAKATNHEWQTHSLTAASSTNAVIEGDDATTDASTATTRLGNQTQISDKVARVAGTQRAIDSAGREDELDFQVMRRRQELKRDMESSLLANNAKVAGNDSTARELAGVESWIATNTSRGTSGTNPTGDGTDAAGNGTQRPFTEALLKTVLQSCWDAGGNPDCVMVGGFNKQAFSNFTGGGTRFDKSEDKRVVAAVDIYESDFGTLKVIPNRFQRSRSALILQTDMWAMATLRPIQSVALAKDGDSDRKQIICEYTLEARNEAASGVVADLTTS